MMWNQRTWRSARTLPGVLILSARQSWNISVILIESDIFVIVNIDIKYHEEYPDADALFRASRCLWKPSQRDDRDIQFGGMPVYILWVSNTLYSSTIYLSRCI